MEALLQKQAKKHVRSLPELRPGYTVCVRQKIVEGGKERLQVYEGLIISTHRGKIATDASFTVRRVVAGVGVEKVFPLHSPTVVGIEVLKVAPVRRAKLFFLRSRKGKAAKLSERFTHAEEFAGAVAAAVEHVEESRGEAGALPVEG